MRKIKMVGWALACPGNGLAILLDPILPPFPPVQFDTESVQTWAFEPVPALKERLFRLM